LSEKKELLNMLRVMWRKGDSPLRRIYPSWEELEDNLEIMVKENGAKTMSKDTSCPYCGVIQKIEKPLDEMFPFDVCKSCKRPFHVNHNLTARKLTEEEKDDMPAEWVRIRNDLNKKKLAITFKLE
jgi:hypothetical protein